MKKTYTCTTCHKRVRTAKKPLFGFLSHWNCPKLGQRKLEARKS